MCDSQREQRDEKGINGTRQGQSDPSQCKGGSSAQGGEGSREESELHFNEKGAKQSDLSSQTAAHYSFNSAIAASVCAGSPQGQCKPTEKEGSERPTRNRLKSEGASYGHHAWPIAASGTVASQKVRGPSAPGLESLRASPQMKTQQQHSSHSQAHPQPGPLAITTSHDSSEGGTNKTMTTIHNDNQAHDYALSTAPHQYIMTPPGLHSHLPLTPTQHQPLPSTAPPQQHAPSLQCQLPPFLPSIS